ncbi:MAG: Rid family hydrolase [Pseudomonadota bacterium]
MTREPIVRRQAAYPAGRSQASAYRDLVWVVATADADAGDLRQQSEQALAQLDVNLAALGSDKSRLVSVQVFLSDINAKPAFDTVWRAWIGSNPDTWPQRACLGVQLGGTWRVEITAVAVRDAA